MERIGLEIKQLKFFQFKYVKLSILEIDYFVCILFVFEQLTYTNSIIFFELVMFKFLGVIIDCRAFFNVNNLFVI